MATVLELLVGMGWKQREAQRMVDAVCDHIGDETKVQDALRAALQQAPTPGFTAPRFTGVREAPARYERALA